MCTQCKNLQEWYNVCCTSCSKSGAGFNFSLQFSMAPPNRKINGKQREGERVLCVFELSYVILTWHIRIVWRYFFVQKTTSPIAWSYKHRIILGIYSTYNTRFVRSSNVFISIISFNALTEWAIRIGGIFFSEIQKYVCHRMPSYPQWIVHNIYDSGSRPSTSVLPESVLPLLYPGNVQILERYYLIGWALFRISIGLL